MRRTTLRVKTLAAATSTLREGNYSIRIPVVGEDEVAQLQADFNEMASNLERSMEDEVIHLQLLVDDLFTLARAEVGKLVRDIVKNSASLVWQSSRIEVVADAPSEIVDVLVDPKRLEQVLRNLLHNAVRHTTPGGIVAVQVKVEPEAVLILVKDTGEGISPKDLPHIWERFYQTERSRTHIDGGAGLGLAL